MRSRARSADLDHGCGTRTSAGDQLQPCRPWSRASPANLRTYPVTRQESFKGPSESYNCPYTQLIGPLSELWILKWTFVPALLYQTRYSRQSHLLRDQKRSTPPESLVTRVPTAPANSLTVQASMTVIPEVILPAKEKEKIFTC